VKIDRIGFMLSMPRRPPTQDERIERSGQPAPPLQTPRRLSELFWAFNHLTLLGVGGVLPFAQRILVEERRWLHTEQFVEINGVRYSHIVNPKTGIGLTNRIQVSIFGKDAVTTDSFATAVCVLGVKHGLTLVESRQDLAALILRKTHLRAYTRAYVQ